MRYRLVVAFTYVTALGWFAYASDGVIPNWVVFAAIFVAPFVAGFWLAGCGRSPSLRLSS